MSGFEDFIRDELPLRQVTVKSSGDPSIGAGYPAAIGTFYLDTTNSFLRYEKIGVGNNDWIETAGNEGSSDIFTFANESTISTTKFVAVSSGTYLADTFSVSDHRSAKYIIHAKGNDTIFCTEILLVASDTQVFTTQYGVLGDVEAVRTQSSLSNGVVSSTITTMVSGLDISMYMFRLS